MPYFAKILETAGITANPGEYIGFHSLRHTLNTRLERAGISSEIRQKIMKHSNPKTNAIYSHDLEQARKAVGKLG